MTAEQQQALKKYMDAVSEMLAYRQDGQQPTQHMFKRVSDTHAAALVAFGGLTDARKKSK